MNVELNIPSATIIYPRIYTPHSFEDGPERFGIGFTCDDEEARMQLAAHQIYPKAKGEYSLYNTNGLFRPLVTEINGNYEAMRAAFAIADIRNISRDKLFVNCEAALSLKVFSYDRMGHKGNGIVLLGLTVDAAPFENLARNFSS